MFARKSMIFVGHPQNAEYIYYTIDPEQNQPAAAGEREFNLYLSTPSSSVTCVR